MNQPTSWTKWKRRLWLTMNVTVVGLFVLLLAVVIGQQRRIGRQQQEIHDLHSRLTRLGEARNVVPKRRRAPLNTVERLPYRIIPINNTQTGSYLRFPVEVERAMIGEAHSRIRKAENGVNRADSPGP